MDAGAWGEIDPFVLRGVQRTLARTPVDSVRHPWGCPCVNCAVGLSVPVEIGLPELPTGGDSMQAESVKRKRVSIPPTLAACRQVDVGASPAPGGKSEPFLFAAF